MSHLQYALVYLTIGAAWAIHLAYWDHGKDLEIFGIDGLPIWWAAGLIWPVTIEIAVIVAIVEGYRSNRKNPS